MSPKHTPAPWSVGTASWSDDGFATYELRGVRTVCKADADLIAAAPALLAALKRLYAETADYIIINNLGDVHHNHAMRAARAAISRARGGE